MRGRSVPFCPLAMARTSLLALVLTLCSGCPLTIVERCEGDGECRAGEVCAAGRCANFQGDDAGSDGGELEPQDGGVFSPSCTSDFQCPAGFRCEFERCTPGARINEACDWEPDCPAGATCNEEARRCEEWCSNDLGCPEGYRCSSDGFCVERCEDASATLGLSCQSSPDCRCGDCVEAEDGGGLRCHRRCRLDRDCPDGGDGACRDRTFFNVCAL